MSEVERTGLYFSTHGNSKLVWPLMEVVRAFLAAELDDSPWVCGFEIAMVEILAAVLLEDLVCLEAVKCMSAHNT